ncbi:MAG: SpoIIE family protein phosphatase, partial [Chloroflexi bacterium]|nr:SpoIIE family protein phosphatase [Chloroflexota bacterium]
VLLTYTDGVPEARDPDRKFFTEQRLLDLVAHPVSDVNTLLDTIMDHLRAHIADADQFDDITMLAARRLAA